MNGPALQAPQDHKNDGKLDDVPPLTGSLNNAARPKAPDHNKDDSKPVPPLGPKNQ